MGSLPTLSPPSITSNFDRLVSTSLIIYNPDFLTVPYRDPDTNFQFEFRLLAGLEKKPGASVPPAQSSNCRPGSDIDVSGYEVADFKSTTHLVAFNKFSSARPHLLILTQDGYRRQHEHLDGDDFDVLRGVLMGMSGGGGDYLAIFNCGIESGCSRLHKHMQVFPAPPDFPLWPDLNEYRDDGEETKKKLPFLCFVHRFGEDGIPSAKDLTGIYQGFVGQAQSSLNAGDATIPHNVILNQRWIVVVPRRRGGINGADVNAAAFVGMVWVPGKEKMDRWVELGPSWVLGEVGLPGGGSRRTVGSE